MDPSSVTVILPTVFEAATIEAVASAVRSHRHRVLIIDDASTDGTAAIAANLAERDGAIGMIHRPTKAGLAVMNGADRPHPIPEGEVHVWVLHPTVGTTSLLDPAEQARAARLRPSLIRHRFIARHSMVRAILARYTGREPGSLRFTIGPFGKPTLAGTPLQFNVSHTGGTVVCAVATSLPVGIDIEDPEQVIDPSLLTDLILSRREKARARALEPPALREFITRTWVTKEAVTKGVGEGLNIPFTEIATFRNATVTRARMSGRRVPWYVWDLPIVGRHLAAVAVPTNQVRVLVIDGRSLPVTDS